MSTLLEQASLVLIPSGYKEDVVYSQIPTSGAGDLSFTRASNGTRINSAGLVEVCPWNLFGNSENGTGTNWGNPYQIASVTLNSTTAPNGTNTGNLVVENSANTNHWFEASFTAINQTPYTISAYFKAKERTQCALYGFTDNFVFSGQVVIFNLSTGTVVSQSGTQTNSIENVGNGWYRCSMTITANASATAYLGYGLANGGNQSYQGNGTSGLYMWGRQLNTGTLKPYFPTTDRLNVPRLTYQNGGGGCPSLLLEKQSTNLVTWSEDFTQTDWMRSNLTITVNDATSPDGTQNADKFTTTSTIFENQVRQGTFSILGNVGSSYTTTVYAKKGTANFLRIRNLFVTNGGTYGNAWFNLNTGAVGSVQTSQTASIQNMGNGWYRCSLTGVVGAVGANNLIDIGFTDTDATNFPTTSVNGYLWGAQLEASSYPTSYIPTTSASATRVADACSKTGISSLIGQTEGVLFVDFVLNGFEDYGTPLSLNDGSANSYIWFTTFANGNIRAEAYSAGNVQAQIVMNGGVIGQRYKMAFGYKANDFVLYINGTQIGTDNNGSVPTNLSRLDYDLNNNWAKQSQKINQTALFKTRLTNAELASLTTI